jgi:diguanylate cyclase (GGDEF)-like protein
LNKLGFTAHRLLISEVPDIGRYLVEIRPQLKLLPNSIDIEADDLLEAKKLNRELLLRRQLKPILPQFDVVLIDTPPAMRAANQAIRDPVTGLFNRGFMEESLTREILRATRTQNAVVVMMLEIERLNGFKKNNGDEAGDALLREFSFLLQAKIRAEDIACRYSEETFGLILPETSFEIALDRAEQIKEAVSACARNQNTGDVVILVGMSVFPDDGANCHTVLQSADSALHRAKEERLRSNDKGRVLG